MKFKEQRGNFFVFDCGFANVENVTLEHMIGGYYKYKDVYIETNLDTDSSTGESTKQDIQTAVKLMQILIEEGLV